MPATKKKIKSNVPAGFLLWKAGNAWQRRIKTALATQNLTHVQYLILETLEQLSAKDDRVTQAKIAHAAGIDVMMTSKVLRLLVKKGFVSRRSFRTDARAFSAGLTGPGTTVLKKARVLVNKTEEEFFSRLVSKRKKFAANLVALTAE